MPWIAVFDPAITTSATRGYYVVYLFHAEQPLVHLSLNQGTVAVSDALGEVGEGLNVGPLFRLKRAKTLHPPF